MPQNIILLIEPCNEKWNFPFKIGNLYLNKSAISEDDANEILFVGQLLKSSVKMTETEIIQKQKLDRQIIENIFKKERSHFRSDRKTHLILSGYVYTTIAMATAYEHLKDQLCKNISDLFGNVKLKSIILTIVNMSQSGLLTKERAENCFFENDKTMYGLAVCGINNLYDRERLPQKILTLTQSDDQDDFLSSIEKRDPTNESKKSIIIRALTAEEMKLVADCDQNYIQKFNAYCPEYNLLAETDFNNHQKLYLQSKCRSRYASLICFRHTILLKDPKISWTKEHEKSKMALLKASRKKAQKPKKVKRKK